MCALIITHFQSFLRPWTHSWVLVAPIFKPDHSFSTHFHLLLSNFIFYIYFQLFLLSLSILSIFECLYLFWTVFTYFFFHFLLCTPGYALREGLVRLTLALALPTDSVTMIVCPCDKYPWVGPIAINCTSNSLWVPLWTHPFMWHSKGNPECPVTPEYTHDYFHTLFYIVYYIWQLNNILIPLQPLRAMSDTNVVQMMMKCSILHHFKLWLKFF